MLQLYKKQTSMI